MLLSSSCVGWNLEVQHSANSDAHKNPKSYHFLQSFSTISFSTKPWGKLRNTNHLQRGCRGICWQGRVSHVCQGYDQHVARADKKNVAESLYDRRKIQQQQTATARIDQHALVLTGIRIVKQCKPETWASSYIRVNMIIYADARNTTYI